MKFRMTEIIDKPGFEQRLKAFKDDTDVGTPSPNDYNSKLYICGPEYEYEYDYATGDYAEVEDSFDAEPEPEIVPEEYVKQMFEAFSDLPFREVAIDPGYYSEDGGEVEPSRISWLLSSKDCKIETLRIGSLEVKTQQGVEQLALAFKGCSSLRALCIDQLHVGYRDVKTIVPLMEALSELPNLAKVRIVLDAFDNTEATKRYATESLPVLKKGPCLGDVDIVSTNTGWEHTRNNPELRNCKNLHAFI